MTDPDHHAQMEEHYSYGLRIQELEIEIEQLNAELHSVHAHLQHYRNLVDQLRKLVDDREADLGRMWGETNYEIERLTADRAQLVLMTELQRKSNQEIERLRAIGRELLDVAERLNPAEHSLARAQLDKLRGELQPENTSLCGLEDGAPYV